MRKIPLLSATFGLALAVGSLGASACSNFGSSDCTLNSDTPPIGYYGYYDSGYGDAVYGAGYADDAYGYGYGPGVYGYAPAYGYGPGVNLYLDGGRRYGHHRHRH